MERAKEICPTTTMGKMKEGALMVDVRRSDEVAEVSFDVPNYIHIPMGQLEERINEISKDKEIVMVCRSGVRSLRTTYFLMNAGYERVYNMSGGIIKWATKKFPITGDAKELLADANCDCSKPNCC